MRYATNSVFVLLCTIVYLFTSCKPSADYTTEISVTDSLKKELVAVAAEFNKLDSQKVKTSRASIEAHLGFITANLKDTIDRNDALLLSNFKQVNKNLGKFTRTQNQLRKFYAHNVKQLDDLAYDLRNGNIENKDSAKYYVLTESEANRALINEMNLHIRVVPGELKKYDSLKPQVQNFIRKINNGTVPPDLLNKDE